MSRLWQVDVANKLVAGHGRIVAEYFEVGRSRQVPWPKRPQAAALLAALGDPANRIDAIVVGEYERSFDTGQFDALRPVLERHGVGLWFAGSWWTGRVRQVHLFRAINSLNRLR